MNTFAKESLGIFPTPIHRLPNLSRELGTNVWIKRDDLCGVALGIASFIKLLLVDRMLFQNPSITVGVSAVVALTLMASVFFAKLVGCALPMLAKKVGFDPAVMAAPFITTIVDALCLIVYFAVATVVLGL